MTSLEPVSPSRSRFGFDSSVLGLGSLEGCRDTCTPFHSYAARFHVLVPAPSPTCGSVQAAPNLPACAEGFLLGPLAIQGTSDFSGLRSAAHPGGPGQEGRRVLSHSDAAEGSASRGPELRGPQGTLLWGATALQGLHCGPHCLGWQASRGPLGWGACRAPAPWVWCGLLRQVACPSPRSAPA